MKQFIALLALLLMSFISQAQSDTCNFSISGKVLDIDTKEPIPYASVKVSGEDEFTMTNSEGEFTLKNLCSEENALVISCFGYCDSICHHHHSHGKSPHFYLTQKVQKLETVVIETERTKEEGTQSIAQMTIGKTQLMKNPTKTLAASIAEVEGVAFTSTGSNVQLPIIHGLYGNRILILNNGLKHGFQNWGTDHAPEIDITSANSITIIKGASGIRFGPDALGGAIIIESNPLYLNTGTNVNFGTSYQTNGQGYSANLEFGEGFKKWSYFINGNYTKIGDRHSPDYPLSNSGKEEKSISAGARYHLRDFDVKFYYSYVDQNLAFLRTSIAESTNALIRAINADEPVIRNPFSYEINEPNQLTQHHLGKVEIKWWYSKEANISFRAGRQWNEREEYDVRRNADRPIIDLDLGTNDYHLEWKHNEWFDLDGLIGLQYFRQENGNNSGTFTAPFIPNYESERFSAFLIESKTFGKNMIELGLRIDYEKNAVAGRESNENIFFDEFNFNNLTGSIGYVRDISESITFRTNLGTAWRSPNMAELYSFGQRGSKLSYGLLRYNFNSQGLISTRRVSTFAESNIEAERGYKFINELEVKKNKNRHAVTVYSHYIENFIFDRPFTLSRTFRGPMPAFIHDQADALFAGLDYSWRRDWNSQITGTLGTSYLWSFNVNKNESLINQPPLQLNYSLSWNQANFWKFESSEFTIRPSYTFEQFQAPITVTPEELVNGDVIITKDSEIFDFADAPNSYFLIEIGWSFRWKNLIGSIRVENLLNTSYRDYLNEMRYFADEPGRNILFSLNYSFSTNNNK